MRQQQAPAKIRAWHSYHIGVVQHECNSEMQNPLFLGLWSTRGSLERERKIWGSLGFGSYIYVYKSMKLKNLRFAYAGNYSSCDFLQ